MMRLVFVIEGVNGGEKVASSQRALATLSIAYLAAHTTPDASGTH